MPIIVNGVELCDEEVERELAWHQDGDDPLRAAVTARILRRVFLDEARRLGMDIHDEERAVSRLLEEHASSPEPDQAACRRFYDANPMRFMVGACVEADHILFQITPKVNLPALHLKAQEILEQLLQEPERFAEYARLYSNCPSAAMGGNLGQITRGAMVPEFERVVFSSEAGTVHPRLVETRYGLHIVRVTRSVPGQPRPYQAVADEIACVLTAMGRDTAWRQYAKVLVARARIEGIDFSDEIVSERLMDGGVPV